jgi:hypothetical protein
LRINKRLTQPGTRARSLAANWESNAPSPILSAVPHCTFVRIYRRISTSFSQSVAIHVFLNWTSSTDSEGTHAVQRHRIESFHSHDIQFDDPISQFRSSFYPLYPYGLVASSPFLASPPNLKAPQSFQNFILPRSFTHQPSPIHQIKSTLNSRWFPSSPSRSSRPRSTSPSVKWQAPRPLPPQHSWPTCQHQPPTKFLTPQSPSPGPIGPVGNITTACAIIIPDDDDWPSFSTSPSATTRTLPSSRGEKRTLSPRVLQLLRTTQWVNSPRLQSRARLSSVLRQVEMQVQECQRVF